MEKRTKQVVGGTVSVAVITAVLGGFFEVQDYADMRYVGQEYYEAQKTVGSIQLIDVQIVQTETQLEIIEQRKKENNPRDGDETRYQTLLDQLKDLEKAKAELMRE